MSYFQKHLTDKMLQSNSLSRTEWKVHWYQLRLHCKGNDPVCVLQRCTHAWVKCVYSSFLEVKASHKDEGVTQIKWVVQLNRIHIPQIGYTQQTHVH